ncbi:MAG TPA: ABC transporter ATP-binding protein [Terriglobales bacterium]
MYDWVIKLENVSKCYRAYPSGRKHGYVTLRDAVMENIRRMFEPASVGRSAQEIWALKNISLEVRPGEVVGIIGSNGAGKTTLLKLMSRITVPTVGRVRLRGRVSSLLEVGTGFHPELTGRENIYLNGSILGMKKKELERKMEAILDFAGVESFADTPVKRFSSGMHLRLAFAIAAHLEPEILILDELLAIADANFQKKCLTRIRDLAARGCALLLVSHNLLVVKELCARAILLDAGRLCADATVAEVLAGYAASPRQAPTEMAKAVVPVGESGLRVPV